MKIILLENVKKLGKKDEIIEVADGYARNVIIPKKLGIEATSANLNSVKLKNKNEEKKDENMRNIAMEDKKKIEAVTITLKIKAGANGKTFGSINSKEISDGIKESVNLDIDKKDIDLGEPIKNIGRYTVKVRLYKEVIANANINVIEE